MRRINIIKISVLVCLLVAVVFAGTNFYLNSNKAKVASSALLQKRTSSVPLQKKTSSHSEYEYAVEFKSIDDVIKYASNVIVGTVVSEAENDANSSIYKFTVEKNIKGNTDSADIDICELKENLQVGEKYILFLNYFDSPLFERPIYTSTYKECMIKVGNDILISQNNFGEQDYKYNEFIKIIEKSSGLAFKKDEKLDIKDKASTLKELKDSSDYILRVIPTDVLRHNKRVATVQIDIVKQYKGNYDNIRMTLPSYVEVGKEYIVFLKTSNGSAGLTTRQGSVVCKDESSEWNKVLKELDQ